MNFKSAETKIEIGLICVFAEQQKAVYMSIKPWPEKN